MGFYKFIRIKGLEGKNTGYFVPRMYCMTHGIAMKVFGLKYMLYRMRGWTIWWVSNEDDYEKAIDRLTELKKTRIFDFQVNA